MACLLRLCAAVKSWLQVHLVSSALIFWLGLLHMQRMLGGDLSIYAAVHRNVSPWLASMCSEGSVTFYKGNLSQIDFLSSLPSADVIIHAATYGQPGKFADFPDETLKLNTLSTFCLLDKLRPGNRFLFLSSSEVYDGLDGAPFH